MSLFEDSAYIWRETFFLMFDRANRPDIDNVQACLADMGTRYELIKSQANDDGEIVSLSMRSPQDFSAMDIVFVEGEEVKANLDEMLTELRAQTMTTEEREKLLTLESCNVRLDILHFEQLNDGKEDEFLDPGGVLIAIERLAQLCEGVGFDPQSQSIL